MSEVALTLAYGLILVWGTAWLGRPKRSGPDKARRDALEFLTGAFKCALCGTDFKVTWTYKPGAAAKWWIVPACLSGGLVWIALIQIIWPA